MNRQTFKDQYTKLPLVPTVEDCKGRTFIITGGNGGLGLECAKHLVKLSAKSVILAVRSMSKGEAAKTEIEAETGLKGIVEIWQLDLSSYDSVKEFAKKVQALDRIDVIIENAAIILDRFSTAEGLETTITVNVVNTLLLAVLVLPKLQESGQRFNNSPHLVFVGSDSALEMKGKLEKLNSGDLLEGLSNAKMDFFRYPTTKLMLLYAVRQLSLLRPYSETGVVINYANPGICTTGLNQNVGIIQRSVVTVFRLILARTAEVGSRTLLHGAVAGKESHGKYLSECEIKEYRIHPWMTNDTGREIQQRVWNNITSRLNAAQPGCI